MGRGGDQAEWVGFWGLVVASIKVVWAWARGADSGIGIGIHGVKVVRSKGSGGEAKARIVLKTVTLVAGDGQDGVEWLDVVWISVVLSGRGELSGDDEVVRVGTVGGIVQLQRSGVRGCCWCWSGRSGSRVPTGEKILLFLVA